MVISELVKVFAPWKVVSILNLITVGSSMTDDVIDVHGWDVQLLSKSTSLVEPDTSLTKMSTILLDWTTHVGIVEVGFSKLKIKISPLYGSKIAVMVWAVAVATNTSLGQPITST